MFVFERECACRGERAVGVMCSLSRSLTGLFNTLHAASTDISLTFHVQAHALSNLLLTNLLLTNLLLT